MKRTIFFLFAMTIGTAVLAVTPPHKTDYVPTTTATPVNCVEIPSDFAKPELYNRSLLDALKGKPVKRVELWYTRYKKSPSFNQTALNDKRVRQLQAAFPELRDPDIEWVWKEQTAAVTEEDAQQCFHGFRLFTESEEPLWTNEYRIEDASNTGEKIQVDNSKGTNFTAKSGTVVHIPAGAVADAEGKPVTGTYTITYTEYRNPAEIAFSGLPMTLSENGHPFMMNSAGMYEIRGTQNGEPLQLTQPVTVDFNCTDKLDDLNFYALDQQTGTWIKEEPLNFGAPAIETVTKVELRPVTMAIEVNSPDMGGIPNNQRANTIYKGRNNEVAVSTFDAFSWKSYVELKKEEPEFIAKSVISDDPKSRTIESHSKFTDELIAKVFQQPILKMNKQWMDQMKGVNDPNATLLAESADKGHTYPNLIKGLNSPKFGVYNCDQQMRMGPTISMRPLYVDKKNGQAIAQPFVTCIIDRKMNASFSFDPTSISLAKDSDCDVILFTGDKKVFHLPASSVAALKTGEPAATFEMKDISAEVKTSDDLKAYLKL